MRTFTPQIGLDDDWMILDLIGWPLGDLLAVIQNHNFIGNVHNHFHVMLHKQDSDPLLFDGIDQSGCSLGFGLDENAIRALKQWRFRPGMRNGVPVDVALNIEVNFNLR